MPTIVFHAFSVLQNDGMLDKETITRLKRAFHVFQEHTAKGEDTFLVATSTGGQSEEVKRVLCRWGLTESNVLTISEACHTTAEIVASAKLIKQYHLPETVISVSSAGHIPRLYLEWYFLKTSLGIQDIYFANAGIVNLKWILQEPKKIIRFLWKLPGTNRQIQSGSPIV